MKRKVLLFSSIVAILFICFLLVTNQPYRFRQEFDQIAKIEVLRKTQPISGYDTPMEVLKTLDIAEHRAFIDGFRMVEGFRIGMDPPSGFGTYIIRITYRNGEIELLSDYNNGYISVDGIVHEDVYCVDRDQFYEFLSGVLGEQVTEPTFK